MLALNHHLQRRLWALVYLSTLLLVAGCAQLTALGQPGNAPVTTAARGDAPTDLRLEVVGLVAPLPAGSRQHPRQPGQPQLLLHLALASGLEARVEVWPSLPAKALDDPEWSARQKAGLRELLPGLEGLGQSRLTIADSPALALDYTWQGLLTRRIYLPSPRGLILISLTAPTAQGMDRADAWLAGLRLDQPQAATATVARPEPTAPAKTEPAATRLPSLPPKPNTPPPPLNRRGQLYSLDPPTLARLERERADQTQAAKDPNSLAQRIEVTAWLSLSRRGLGLPDAQRDWSRLRARAVSAWRRLPEQASSHRTLGLAMLLEDRLAKARHYLERAAELEPGDAANWLALCQLPDLEPARRLEMAEKARALSPELPAGPLCAAKALVDLQRPSEAATLYAQTLEVQPDNLAGLLGLARLEMDQPANLEEAGQRLARAAELEPDLEAARFNLALVRLRQDRPAEALTLAEAICEAHPQDPAALNLRGTIQLRLDRPAQARRDFQAAIQAGPGHAQAHYNLGGVCAGHFKDTACAREAFQRYLELEPSGPRADKARAWLIRQGGGS
ncbi:MAG: tetratricopeptide repeat protein [Desulfarculus sp.]|nr:tetratricopeptide repeat protein [Desulfarculus sp.]